MLSDFDKKLLNELQQEIPLESRPYARIAEKLGTSEQIVLERIEAMKNDGYIRRMGAFFDSAALGFKGTLIAVKVDEDEVADTAQFISSQSGVTHNYERRGEYNLWFTLQVDEEAKKEKFLRELLQKKGVHEILDLPVEEKFKLKVQLPL